MKNHVFWRLFNAAVLITVVWSAMGFEVYGGWNDSGSGGTLLDVFRGRGNSSNSNQTVSAPTPSAAPMTMSAPQMTSVPSVPAPQMTNVPNVPAPQMTNVNDYGQPYGTVEGTPRFPSSQYVPPASPTMQPQNKWSLKNLFNGSASNQSQYMEPMPPSASYSQPHSHASHPVMTSGHPVMASGKNSQYPVVPLDSQDFLPQEGAIYNEKGEMIYNPQSGEPMPNIPTEGMVYDENGNNLVIENENNAAVPINEPESAVKKVIMGNRAKQSASVNQERVYPNSVIPATPQPIPAQMPVNPYAQQPSVGVGHPPVGSGNSILDSGNSGTLKLESGSTAFSKTYKPGPVRTSVPSEPVMDMTGPELTEALPQLGSRDQVTENGNLPSANPSPIVPRLQSTPNPAIGASTPAASPVIEDIHTASPLENLSEKSDQTPALEPVPEIDIPKEKEGNREQGVGNSNSPEANSTPLATRNSQPAADNRLAASQPATPTEPLVIEIDGPEEVEFGKNEMFSLSVINPTDAVRRDVVLSVHPEGFGDDKTASLNLEQLAPNEKKSVSMKLNARQYNNLSLTAHVRDELGLETTKKINVNVKNESVKISILPPQAGNAYVGQPTQYIVRIVNNAAKEVSLNAMAFFGNGIEPIRASGAPNTIQSGQVVVNKPIELKQGEMRDLKIVAVAFQPGIHKILVQLIDSRGATYAAKESCAYRQREFDEDETETIETDAKIELTPGKSEIGVWKAAGESGNSLGIRQETVDMSESAQATNGSEFRQTRGSADGERRLAASQLATPDAPALNAADAVPLTQPDQGPRGDLIMPMFAQ